MNAEKQMLKHTSTRSLILLISTLALSSFINQSRADWDSRSRGFTVVPSGQESLCTENFFQSVRNLKSIGANMVSIRVAWSHQRIDSSTIDPYIRTTSNEALRCGIEFIQSQGMDFGIGLVINGPAWRATFEPEDRDAWFKSMGELAVRYSRDFAQPYGATYFSLGTEMYSLVSNEHNSENAAGPGRYRWPEIINDVRSEYSGLITYSAQHSGDRSAVFEDNDLMPNLDVLGFSGYWPLYATNTRNLLNEWARIEREIILPAYNRYGKPLELAEIGYRPCSFTFERPYDSQTECTFDGEAQSLAWDALLTFFADKSYLIGLVGGWAWSDSPYFGGPENTDFTPWGKPAAQTIAGHWPALIATEEPPVPFGESQLAAVPYCDPADTAVSESGWGDLSNYAVNGESLSPYACIFLDGPSDNEFGVVINNVESTEDTPLSETGNGTPTDNSDDPVLVDSETPLEVDTPGDGQSQNPGIADEPIDGGDQSLDDGLTDLDTLEPPNTSGGAITSWFLLILMSVRVYRVITAITITINRSDVNSKSLRYRRRQHKKLDNTKRMSVPLKTPGLGALYS